MPAEKMTNTLDTKTSTIVSRRNLQTIFFFFFEVQFDKKWYPIIAAETKLRRRHKWTEVA